jgi:hypothetical protein
VFLPEPESPVGVAGSGEARGIGVLLRQGGVIESVPSLVMDPSEEEQDQNKTSHMLPQSGHGQSSYSASASRRISTISYIS